MVNTHNWRKKSGFTLVELSIVLVILGLLVGGVLSGQALIHAAELRAVSTEFLNFKTAIGTFRDKYFALPGDMRNATRYWDAQAGATTEGAVSACAALGYADPATDAKTCNGDGNGIVDTPLGVLEFFRAWQHLSNAGLIEGTYTGVDISATIHTTPGVNVPRSRISTAGWTLMGWGSQPDSSVIFGGNYGNALEFGTTSAISYDTIFPVLRAEDAFNIDQKMDDGRPGTGFIRAEKNGALVMPDCVASGNTDYDMINTTNSCALIFITGY